MLTDKIELFLEVADALCFADVAKKRYTTQPTVSRQISALEDEWGLRLFVRTNKGLRLTPEGSVMVTCCKKMVQQCEAGLKRARDLKTGKREALRLGLLETLDHEQLLIPFLLDFSARYPDLDLTLSHMSFSELRSGLCRQSIDIAYTLSFDVDYIDADVVVSKVADLDPFFVISNKHPLFGKEDLTIRDLAGDCFYVPDPADAPGREKDLQRLLKLHGIDQGSIRYISNLESVLFQVRAGKGVALLNTENSRTRSEDYRVLKLENDPKRIELVSVWRRDNLNPSLALLENEQREHFQIR